MIENGKRSCEIRAFGRPGSGRAVFLGLHSKMFRFWRSQRCVIMDVVDREDDADKRANGFLIHRIRHAGITLPEIITIAGVYHIK